MNLFLDTSVLLAGSASALGASREIFDRPILFSALAWSDVLLTLDRGDFGELLGKTFYELWVLTPGAFLEQERAAGRLK